LRARFVEQKLLPSSTFRRVYVYKWFCHTLLRYLSLTSMFNKPPASVGSLTYTQCLTSRKKSCQRQKYRLSLCRSWWLRKNVLQHRNLVAAFLLVKRRFNCNMFSNFFVAFQPERRGQGQRQVDGEQGETKNLHCCDLQQPLQHKFLKLNNLSKLRRYPFTESLRLWESSNKML